MEAHRRALFNKLVEASVGQPIDVVAEAAINLLVNALRKAHAKGPRAASSFDQLSSTAKTMLMSHYDNVGNRRNIFPFDQNVEVPLIDAREQFLKN
jgi:hypothetical protein